MRMKNWLGRETCDATGKDGRSLILDVTRMIAWNMKDKEKEEEEEELADSLVYCCQFILNWNKNYVSKLCWFSPYGYSVNCSTLLYDIPVGGEAQCGVEWLWFHSPGFHRRTAASLLCSGSWVQNCPSLWIKHVSCNTCWCFVWVSDFSSHPKGRTRIWGYLRTWCWGSCLELREMSNRRARASWFVHFT